MANSSVFQNQGWWKHTIAYEIYPSSFQDSNGDGYGDINGITSRLDYLKSLQVGAIWLTPVYASPMVDNGYDVSDFYKINPLYGTMEDMDRLIAEADKRNIKIVMDLVFNHTSEECEWFKESRKSRNNPKSDWYIWKDGIPSKDGTGHEPPNNWRSIFGVPAWTWCEERKQYYLHTFATQQPDLNWENPDVRKALYDIANFWINKGVGGFRIDAIPYIKKPPHFASGKPDAGDGMVSIHTMTVNTDGILDFLQEFKANVTEGKNVFTVAEANGVGPEDLKYWVGDKGAFDMLFEFGHLHDIEIWCKPTPFGIMDFKKALLASQKATAKNGWYPVFFENHDKPRCVHNFFSPQVANNPIINKLAAKALAILMTTLRGTPFFFEGQEIGMTNVKWNSIDKYDELNTIAQYNLALSEGFDNNQAMDFVNRFSRDNARTPMQWNSGPNAGFTTGKPWLSINENFVTLNVANEEQDKNSVLNFYRTLIELRQNSTALNGGELEIILEEHPQVIGYKRGEYTILINMDEAEVSLEPGLFTVKERIISNYGDNPSSNTLQPLEAVILKAN
ncbi:MULTISPECIES: alpha-glucosidase [unclassified Fibrobacter]|uniref:alpha-glucosidase n=1 Tax=unclassified Fibrobacter TaxID=2634177 RepID=UPI000D6ACF45|nr:MULTISPECIES: alpha-glucosidase [unclassified Fibrobacter]PWJ66250.1 alpha-glucosidase [Fibrobacter sp. UWR4]PZW69454.1 alpha-glucosidase [Fibrobacter sp. UWR1]